MDAGPRTPPANEKAASPTAEARRCRLTLLFCDLCGSTSLSRAMEAEDYAQLLSLLRAEYQSAVTRQGGTLVRVQGDGMLAVFGYPQPREGDGRRAVETAVELHRSVAEIAGYGPSGRAGELRLHSGIHAGIVLVKRGDLMLGTLELLGMAPNIASHLSSAAARGEILVTEETLGPDRFFFDTGPQRLVPVDSDGTLVASRAVFGRSQLNSSFEARAQRGLQPFIGRETEVRQLEDYLGQALAGDTRQVAIAGPPGIGKTRLAQFFLAQARWKGCRVLKGYCVGESGGEPLQPLVQMLRHALDLAPDASPAQARAALGRTLDTLRMTSLLVALLQTLGVPDEHGDPHRSAPPDGAPAALGALFGAIAALQPLVLFVDDWQWSDAVTRQTLSALDTTAPGVPLMVLASTRSISAGDAMIYRMEVIDLAPFSDVESSRSIRSLLPQADPFVAADICRYSGGNALFIEELCHSAAHEDMDRRLVPQHGGAEWLNVLVESRVARLPDDEAELVRIAAVIGNVIPSWLVRELTGRADDDPALRALAELDFVFPDAAGTLRFKHGLTRDVIYESVGLHVRRGWHLRIAQALKQRAAGEHELPHEALAYHFGAAEQPAESAHHAEQAGDRAAAVSALDRAKSLYRTALVRLDQAHRDGGAAARWIAIANKLGLICVFDASRKELPVFQRAVELARAEANLSLLARAEYWLGYILYALGESQSAIGHCERALAAAGAPDAPLAVQIRSTLGQVKAAASDYAGAAPLLAEAVSIKRGHHRSSRPAVGLAYSLVCLAAVSGDRGDFERAYACFDEAWSLLHGATHEIGASIQGWRAAVLTWQGRWADARAAAQESASIAEQTRSLFQLCQGRVTAAYADWKLSGDERFIAIADQATAWLEPRESGLFRSLNHGWLADGWIGCGQRGHARRHAVRALRRGRKADLIGAAMTYRALARDCAATGDNVRARHYIALAQRVAERRESPHEAASNRLCAAELALARHARDEARSDAQFALEAFEALGMHWHAERARTLVAEVWQVA